MAYSSRFLAEINAIETVYSGLISFDEIKNALTEILELAYKHQVTRFLADCTDIKGSGAILDSYEFAKEVEKVPDVHRLKEAFILPVMKEAADSVRFFETTATNRGLNIRAFPSREEAIMWLIQ